MEHTAVLPGHADVPAGLFHLVDGLAVGGAPVGAVQKQQVCSFGLGHAHTREMLGNVPAGVVYVLGQHGAQLVHPGAALGGVGSQQCVHGQDIHLVIMCFFAAGGHTVPQRFVVYDVVASDQPGQVEGLAGGVQRDRALAGILTDGLGGDVLVAAQDDIGPDLVGDDGHAVFAVDVHGLFNFPPLPHAAAGVVGRAENRRMDVVFFAFAVHVGVVHPPDAVLVLHQRAVYDAVAVILQRVSEADVGGAVQQHRVAGGGQAPQRRRHAAQHTVFVTDGVLGQPLDAVAVALPADDGVIVGVRRQEIAVQRVGRARNDSGGDGGYGGKVHVGHPHGDSRKAVFGCGRRKAGFAQALHSECIFAVAVVNGGKIVGHGIFLIMSVGAGLYSARVRSRLWTVPRAEQSPAPTLYY